MLLSDSEILKRMALEVGNPSRVEIKPSFEWVEDPLNDVQPASVDLRLGREFLVPTPSECTLIDPTNLTDYTSTWELVDVGHKGNFILHPGEFVLGTTDEWVEIPNDLSAEVDGRSFVGRLGLTVHVTAGFIDPGFKGNITLEMVNLNRVAIKLCHGLSICQLKFTPMLGEVKRPYGHPTRKSKFQGQKGPQASRCVGQ
jgi:dCTP deaminase